MSSPENPILPAELIKALADRIGLDYTTHRGSIWTQNGGSWVEVELEGREFAGRLFKITVEEIT